MTWLCQLFGDCKSLVGSRHCSAQFMRQNIWFSFETGIGSSEKGEGRWSFPAPHAITNLFFRTRSDGDYCRGARPEKWLGGTLTNRLGCSTRGSSEILDGKNSPVFHRTYLVPLHLFQQESNLLKY